MTGSTQDKTPQHGGQIANYPSLYINGEWSAQTDGGVIESVDPATGKVWAHVAYGGANDIDRAVAAARQAFDGPWGKMPGHERAILLRRFADLYQKNVEPLALIETRDSGRALRETRADLGGHPQYYQWFASLADKTQGTTIPLDDSVHAFTTRIPIGVVGVICPWNVPLMSICWKIGPALAAGCTVVIKPAETTSVTALELAKLFDEIGFPPGVLNVVPGYGANGAGQELVEHDDVDKISFTGEGNTARNMLKTGNGNLKKFTFELGGKSPHIIFDDADVEQAINAATNSAWTLCGQSCALGSRVMVQRPVYDQVVEAFAARAQKVRVGMPLDANTHMGPQNSPAQLEKTLGYVDIGRSEGAELIAGGNRLDHGDLANGYFIEPTVFAGATNDMRISREEIFGPVATLIPFDEEDEAVAIANDTNYGLTAGLWTRDNSRAHRVSGQIRAGIVWVNTYRYIRWSTPYGGFKSSGWGRENGVNALDGFLETRTTVFSKTGTFPDAYAD